MGREVKRVSLDFDWPLDEVWGGYVNPFYHQRIDCPECDGTGSSPGARLLKDQWYGYAPFRPEDRGSVPFKPTDEPVRRFAKRNVQNAPEFYGSYESDLIREARRLCEMWNTQWCHHLNDADVAALIEGERLYDFTHHFIPGEGWKPNDPVVIPTAVQVNAWSIGGFGHDSINQWLVVSAECKRLGIVQECQRCDGDGGLWPSAAIKRQAEDWAQTEPPGGEGWQVWETVSEGSPVTPVFQTRETLIDYLMEGGDSSDREYGRGGWTRENAEAFVTAAWAPSMTMIGGVVRMARDGIPA